MCLPAQKTKGGGRISKSTPAARSSAGVALRLQRAAQGELRRGACRASDGALYRGRESLGVPDKVGWLAAACPPWTPPADGLRRASDEPCAG
jgi:hypothetical protein